MNETGDKVKAFQAGGVDYVTKPFQFEEVYARIQTHLQLHRLEKLRDDLTHMVIHDLRNPLMVIFNSLDIIEFHESKTSPPAPEFNHCRTSRCGGSKQYDKFNPRCQQDGSAR